LHTEDLEVWTGQRPKHHKGNRLDDSDPTIARLVPQIRRCMRSAARKGNWAYGTAHVAFGIDCAGRVTAIRTITEDVEPWTVQCISTLLVKAHFEPREDAPLSHYLTVQLFR
jgi:hypothetical protein